MTGPRVFSIPAGACFVDELARGILDEAGDGDPLALTRWTVLLPTRRACRSLAEAFLRARDGRPVLLPRLLPLGDIGDGEDAEFDPGEASGMADAAADLAPAISTIHRQVLLARAISAWRPAGTEEQLPVDQAAWLAADLGRFLDRVQAEGLSLDALDGLAPEAFADHWQKVLDFLDILRRHWPEILTGENAMDPVDRRNRLAALQVERWRATPPADPVIAAGSTGSLPATADLLAAVVGLPRGRVVLPGLDQAMDDGSWQALEASHPQYGLARLLARLDIDRADVPDWPGVRVEAVPAARARLASEIMRPAATCDAWREDPFNAATADLAMRPVWRYDCPGPAVEAGVIALLMRGALETDGRTAALVTTDRGLARRVAGELRRWGIEVDDSAGEPLGDTVPGAFLRLTAGMVAARFAPVPLLSVCKHPLAALGLAPAAFRAGARRLERAILRGPRPAPGFAGLGEALEFAARKRGRDGPDPELVDLLDRLRSAAGEFAGLLDGARGAPPAAMLDAHIRFAEAMAGTDAEPGGDRLWAGEAGEQAALFVDEARRALAGHPPVSGDRWPGLLEALMGGRVVRPRWGRHPGLHIWGPLEARLQRADLMIVGGLNEETWPRDSGADPWMSRQMRERFGLPPPERIVGLAAHDFVQAFSAPTVALTRSTRVDGNPTVPSRWLLRLEAVLAGLGLFDPENGRFVWDEGPHLAWQDGLDAHDGPARPAAPPEPRPPLAARPRRLSVTGIERLMRDPYAIYARHILGLRPLEDPDADPGAAEYGTVIHAALEGFVRECPERLPDDAREKLVRHGRLAFGPALAMPGVAAFWWPRFERVVDWFLDLEAARRGGLRRIYTEIGGAATVAGPAGPFEVTARADRIEQRRDGGLAIIDYKTGQVPAAPALAGGRSPQLPLEAWIAAAAGFPDLPAGAVVELAFWQAGGGFPPGAVRDRSKDLEAVVAAATDGIRRLVAAFDDPATPYLSEPDGREARRPGDYAQLARQAEWSVGGEDGW